MENRCIVCGEIIPEGRQVCYRCERKGNVTDWLNEIIDDPEEWHRFYSDAEVKTLAEQAKELT